MVGRLRERERELAAVEVLLEHRGGMLVLEGRAGIGKTSLVEVARSGCSAVYAACGGNPLYLAELLRAADLSGRPLAALEPAELLAGGLEGIARLVITRVRSLGPDALGLAQALAVLGDDCELRHAAAIAGMTTAVAARLAGGLVRAEVLTVGDRPRFVHPVIRDALEASLDSGGKDCAHRCAARLLHADAAPPGQVAAHLMRVQPAGDGWVLARLREAARAAMDSGAPQAAAGLLDRGWPSRRRLSSGPWSCGKRLARR